MKRIDGSYCVVLILVLLIAPSGMSAQPSILKLPGIGVAADTVTTPHEVIFMHTDRNKYIAGEDIWFSICNIDGESGKLFSGSIVAYVELLNPWNEPVIQSRVKLTAGRGQGSFSLPDSISSGTYTIRAYTNRMKDFLPYACYMHDIDIYNPFKSSVFVRKVIHDASSEGRSVRSAGNAEWPVKIEADSIYGRRERVSLKIGTTVKDLSQAGNTEMSISVAPAEVSDTSRWQDHFVISDTMPGHYTFESDGHYLSGQIKYREDNVSDSSHFLYMSVQGKVAEFKYAKIDTGGRFTFILPVDSKLRNLILQPENATGNMSLEIEPPFPRRSVSSECYREPVSGNQLDVFNGLSFNYQAARIYGTLGSKEADKDDLIEKKGRRFYGIPEMDINLDDYIRLPSMQEVFFELVPGVIIRSRKSLYEVKITNPLTGSYYDEPPLVMIDGVIINDLTVLVDLNPETVEKIEVVKTPYLIGDLVLHGIVNVITRSGDFSDVTMPAYAVILPYRVVDRPSVFAAPDYSDEQIRLSRKPDLRNTLYWNPGVSTNINGVAEVEFWTSDLPGRYVITIQGISATGEIVSLHKFFRIK